MNVVICDDDTRQLRNILENVVVLPEMHSASPIAFTDPGDLFRTLGDRQIAPDIAILDVHMEPNGIEIAKRIQQGYPSCRIIFVTSHIAFATQVYDVIHTYFLLKSELPQRMGDAIRRAISELQAENEQRVVLFIGTQKLFLRVQDILYFERIDHKTFVSTLSEDILTRQKPILIMGDKAHLFVQCHTSYHVNPIWIKRIAKDSILLRNDVTIPMSRAFAAKAKAQALHAIQDLR